MATTKTNQIDDKVPAQATAEAAVAAIDKDPADLTAAEALSFIQAFNRVPPGWSFDPRAGVQKIG